MTVNTNGTKSDMRGTTTMYDIYHMVVEIRESQMRTEAMVKGFIEDISKNPMLKMMAGKFAGK